MAVVANRSVTIVYSGDVVGTQVFEAAENVASPGVIELKTLASGPNTITVPTGGSTVTSVTIHPPAANAIALTLKGVTGDTGVPLHLTDPTTVALASGSVSFCLTAGALLAGVRFVWT